MSEFTTLHVYYNAAQDTLVGTVAGVTADITATPTAAVTVYRSGDNVLAGFTVTGLATFHDYLELGDELGSFGLDLVARVQHQWATQVDPENRSLQLLMHTGLNRVIPVTATEAA